jgi:hypothetical protein
VKLQLVATVVSGNDVAQILCVCGRREGALTGRPLTLTVYSDSLLPLFTLLYSSNMSQTLIHGSRTLTTLFNNNPHGCGACSAHQISHAQTGTSCPRGQPHKNPLPQQTPTLPVDHTQGLYTDEDPPPQLLLLGQPQEAKPRCRANGQHMRAKM